MRRDAGAATPADDPGPTSSASSRAPATKAKGKTQPKTQESHVVSNAVASSEATPRSDVEPPRSRWWSPADDVRVDEACLFDGRALETILEAAQRHAGERAFDRNAIERAFEVAASAHAEQRRKSGEPYLVHPVRVATTIATLGLDTESIVAGLLHDAVEDSELTVFEIAEQFGREVANIVDGVTKLGKVPYLSKQEQQAESFRKMLLAMSRDIRVLVVKLLDRLDNMRTLEHMPRDKQERISRETMQIYAPLAGRLGIEWIRRELQDLSFRYLEPETYAQVQAEIQELFRTDPDAVERTVDRLRQIFSSQGENGDDEDGPRPWPEQVLGSVDVRATPRPPYRAHRRLESSGRGVDQLSDIVTFQVITRDRGGCYAALGQLHARLQPIPGRFRDYIALPRPNHYRALHTSVIDRDGRRLEIHIRSARMDAVAERGIVAQWEFGRGRHASDSLAWLGQLLDWQDEVTDPHEFIEAVKADLFADEVYVFTPRGDIHTFPKGATPIDFAFAIHTDLGMHCSGARVNGHVVPLRYRMHQGDTVEILTNPQVGPREEWLKMCVTSRARAKIKHYLRNLERERLRRLGRSLVEQEVEARGHDLHELEAVGRVDEQAEPLGLGKEARGADGVYEAVGAGQLSASRVADALEPPKEESEAERGLLTRMLRRMAGKGFAKKEGPDALGALASAPLVVTQERVEPSRGSEALVILAACCSPVPGDALLGYFEPGQGVIAHVHGCPEALEHVSERRVHLKWDPKIELECPVTLEVRTVNKVGLLAEMSRAFSHHEVNIKQANCRAYGNGVRAINTFQATVGHLEQLQALIATLRKIPGVVGVDRVFTRTSTSSSRV